MERAAPEDADADEVGLEDVAGVEDAGGVELDDAAEQHQNWLACGLFHSCKLAASKFDATAYGSIVDRFDDSDVDRRWWSDSWTAALTQRAGHGRRRVHRRLGNLADFFQRLVLCHRRSFLW